MAKHNDLKTIVENNIAANNLTTITTIDELNDKNKQTDKKIKYTKLLEEIGDGKVGHELTCLIGSRHKLIYITTTEERRALDCLKIISLKESYELIQWDLVNGMVDTRTGKQVSAGVSEVHTMADSAIANIIDEIKNTSASKNDDTQSNRARIYIFFDLHHFINGDGNPRIERMLKEFSSLVSKSTIIVVSPSYNVCTGLVREFTVIDFPFPSKNEIKRSLNMILGSGCGAKFPQILLFARDREEDLLNAVSGLTLTESENAFAKAITKHKSLGINTILEEKKQMIRKSGFLEFRDSRFTFDDVGGLDLLKEWLLYRKMAFSKEAFEFGIDIPKGLLILGVPGTGKSMTIDALSNLYEVPALRLDISSIFSSLVGDSEKNLRESIKIAEAAAPIILQIEEVEKAIGGVQSSNHTDGGVTSRILGTLLTWMQEKTKPVFVVCTANNVTDIPPEFMRAGRFDEIFFVDLPNDSHRVDVIKKILTRKKRDFKNFNIQKIVEATKNYSPSEIEKGVNNALFVAFSDGKRDLNTNDIVSELGKFQPLYNTRREDIEKMRRWAIGENGVGGRARPASSVTAKVVGGYEQKNITRNIDFSDDDI